MDDLLSGLCLASRPVPLVILPEYSGVVLMPTSEVFLQYCHEEF